MPEFNASVWKTRMTTFNIGDLVSVQISASGDVGPIGLSGTVQQVESDRVLVTSSHTGDEHWYPLAHCSVITPASRPKKPT